MQKWKWNEMEWNEEQWKWKMKQNTVNFKRQGFLVKGSIYMTDNIFDYYVFNLKRKWNSNQNYRKMYY